MWHKMYPAEPRVPGAGVRKLRRAHVKRAIHGTPYSDYQSEARAYEEHFRPLVRHMQYWQPLACD